MRCKLTGGDRTVTGTRTSGSRLVNPVPKGATIWIDSNGKQEKSNTDSVPGTLGWRSELSDRFTGSLRIAEEHWVQGLWIGSAWERSTLEG